MPALRIPQDIEHPGQAPSATTVNSTTANCFCPPGREHMRGRVWGRPVMGADPRAQTSSPGGNSQSTEPSAHSRGLLLYSLTASRTGHQREEGECSALHFDLATVPRQGSTTSLQGCQDTA